MRIVFAGTPLFAQIQLEALLRAKQNIVAVYTQPDKPAGRGQTLHMSPVKETALKHGIPVEQPNTLKTQAALVQLAQYQPDVMIVAAYGLLLPESILNSPRYGCINVHASLLPRWRGASPIQQAILCGDEETGITLMRMDKGLDTGNILISKACHIDEHETSATLHDKLALLGANLLVENLSRIVHSEGTVQDNTKATHAGKITKEQAHLNWHCDAIEIDRKIRAFNPWPVAFCHANDHMIRIWQARSMEKQTQALAGTIIDHTSEGVVVATRKGAILLLKGQLSGKKAMPFSEILKGHGALFAVGQVLA